MPLQSMCIIGHEPGPHLLITGGVHGDEFEPMAAIRRLPFTTWLRLERVLEGRDTAALLVGDEPIARSTRGQTIHSGSVRPFDKLRAAPSAVEGRL